MSKLSPQNSIELSKAPKNMENNIEDLDSQTQEEVVEPKTTEEIGLPADPIEVEPKDDEEADIEALKQRLQNQYEVNKKLRGFVRDKEGKWVKKEQLKPEPKTIDGSSDDITIMELKSLLAAGIQDDSDTEEVRLYARSHKMSITDALKLNEVKSLLKTRIEMRKTAEATNIGGTRRGPSKPSEEALISTASQKGIIPTDEEDLRRMIRARKGIK